MYIISTTTIASPVKNQSALWAAVQYADALRQKILQSSSISTGDRLASAQIDLLKGTKTTLKDSLLNCVPENEKPLATILMTEISYLHSPFEIIAVSSVQSLYNGFSPDGKTALNIFLENLPDKANGKPLVRRVMDQIDTICKKPQEKKGIGIRRTGLYLETDEWQFEHVYEDGTSALIERHMGVKAVPVPLHLRMLTPVMLPE